jgi:hypothetical protein
MELLELKIEVASLKEKMEVMNTNIEGLLKAWNSAQGMTSFVKVLAGLITGCATIWGVVQLFVKFKGG